MKVDISESQIRNRASKQSFSRGYGYYRHGAISATIQRGFEIEGICEGSYEGPYHVRASLSAAGDIGGPIALANTVILEIASISWLCC